MLLAAYLEMFHGEYIAKLLVAWLYIGSNLFVTLTGISSSFILIDINLLFIKHTNIWLT